MRVTASLDTVDMLQQQTICHHSLFHFPLSGAAHSLQMFLSSQVLLHLTYALPVPRFEWWFALSYSIWSSYLLFTIGRKLLLSSPDRWENDPPEKVTFLPKAIQSVQGEHCYPGLWLPGYLFPYCTTLPIFTENYLSDRNRISGSLEMTVPEIKKDL